MGEKIFRLNVEYYKICPDCELKTRSDDPDDMMICKNCGCVLRGVEAKKIEEE